MAAWVERDLDTMRRARILALSEEVEERKKVLTDIWQERVGLNHPEVGSMHSGRVRVCIGIVGRDESMVGRCESGKKSRNDVWACTSKERGTMTKEGIGGEREASGQPLRSRARTSWRDTQIMNLSVLKDPPWATAATVYMQAFMLFAM